MRTEKEMMSLIMNAAERENRIRAVILNGSRANDFVTKDRYQDYDIVYFVNDFQFFIDNKNWIDIFGDRIMLEMPIYKDFYPSEYDGEFNYQMLFTDGNRIDLTFASIDKIKEVFEKDKVGKILLDKDNLLIDIKYDNGTVYFIKKPTKKEFKDKCNCFWWVLQNIAKGIKRKELPYAMSMFNYARENLDYIVSWYIGMCHDYKVSSGKMGKYFSKYLDGDLWEKYVSTFPTGDYDAIWISLFAACKLFRELGVKISREYLYEYPYDDDKRMTEYLIEISKLA